MNVSEILSIINNSPLRIKEFVGDKRKGVQKGIFLYLRNFFASSYQENSLSNELFDLFDVPILYKNVFSYDRELLSSISGDRLMLLFPLMPEKVFDEICRRKSNLINDCLHIFSSELTGNFHLLNVLKIYTKHFQFNSFVSMIENYFWNDLRIPDWLKEYITEATENIENVWSGDFPKFDYLFNTDFVYPLRYFSEEEIRKFLISSITYRLENGKHKPGHSDVFLSFILKRELIPIDQELLNILALWRFCITDVEVREYVKGLISNIHSDI